MFDDDSILPRQIPSRRAPLCLVLLLLMILPSPVVAQAEPLFVWDGTDPLDDVESVPAVPVAPDYVDLTQVHVVANLDSLEWVITLSGMGQRDPVGYTPPEYWLEFTFENIRFHAEVVPLNLAGSETLTDLRLYRASDSGWDLTYQDSGHVDAAAATVQAIVPWNVVTTSAEEYPLAGNRIALVEMVSYWDTDPGTLHDEFPEEYDVVTYRDAYAFPEEAVLTVPGSEPTGLQVTVSSPIRFSNGEATTVHWPLKIRHEESVDKDILITVAEANPRFTVDVPPAVRIPAGETVVVNLFVTIPFAHQHGVTENVQLDLVSDGETTQVQVGIEYPLIPQPAGHHNMLYGHGSEQPTLLGGGNRQFWINPSVEDDRDTLPDYPRQAGTCTIDGSNFAGHSWWFPLDPGLRIGLDARTGEVGTFTATLQAPELQTAGVLYARLKLIDESLNTLLVDPETYQITVDDATLQTAVEAIQGPGESYIEADLPMPPELDFVTPQSEKNLGLLVVFCEDQQVAGNSLTTALTMAQSLPVFYLSGLSLALPLNEYHDPVAIDAASDGARFSSTETRIEAPPGSVVLFTVDLQGSGDRFDVRLLGSGADIATLHAGPRVKLGVEIPVSFMVPLDARTGDSYEVVLLAEQVDRPSVSAAVRLTVLIDESATRDDSSLVASLEGSERTTPFPFSAGLLAVSVALFARRRRTEAPAPHAPPE